MKRFSTLLLCCLCVFLPALLPAQTWVNGQPATWVIGQPNFTATAAGNANINLNQPYDVAVDAVRNKLYVADFNNNRILRFGLPITSNNQAPEIVLGQAAFGTSAPGLSATQLNAPSGIAVDLAGNLWVSDRNNHRVIRFPMPWAAASGAAADVVKGQADFISNLTATSAAGMNQPLNVKFNAVGDMFVAEGANNRVTRFPQANLGISSDAADLVLGQPGFVTNAAALTANGMSAPSGLAFDAAGNLFVGDGANHRVLRFNAGFVSSAAANGVLGQINFMSNVATCTISQMNFCSYLATDAANNLYVGDRDNARVLIFNNAAAKPNGANADNVLGQQIFTTNTNPTPQCREYFANGAGGSAYGLCFSGTQLFVCDRLNNRILVFDQNLPSITSISPNIAANIASTLQPITPTFNQAMNLLTAINFRAFGGMSGLKNGTFAGGGMTTPSFTPAAASPYFGGEKVEFTIATGATLGDGASSSAGNKPFLNGFRPLARATPFVSSYRTSAAVPAGGVNFVLSTYATIGGDAVAIAPADFDGDGYVDFAAASNSAGRVAVRRNMNYGNFAKTVAAGEFLDIAAAGLLDLKAADMDNDGKPDWIYTDGATLFIRQNTSTPGNLTAAVLAPGITATGAQKIETGDFDGDGDIDVAVITSAPSIIIYRNLWVNPPNAPLFALAVHSTTTLPNPPTALAKGDFNNDASLDIAVGFSVNNILTYHNDGGGRMIQTPVNQILPSPPIQLVTGNIDNVPGTDILAFVPMAPSRAYFLPNTALGSFVTATPYTTPGIAGTVGGIELGDIDGSGSLDVVSASLDNAPTPSRMAWFRNNGVGVFGAAGLAGGTVGLVNSNASCINLCDLDGDGDLDALVGYNAGAAFPYVAVLRNEQQPTPTTFGPVINAQNVNRTSAPMSQTFSTSMTTGTASLVDAITPAPLQGGPIRIFGNMTGGRSRIGVGGTWAGSGTNNATFTPNNLTGPSSANQFYPGELVSVSIPNFQTNAVKSLRFVPITSGTATNIGGHVRQFRTNTAVGPGRFDGQVPGSPFAAGTGTYSVALGDVDGDGDLDVVASNFGSANVTVLLNNGSGVYSPVAGSPFAVGASPQFVALGDVDNDGDLDLATSSFGSVNITVLLNNGAGSYTPAPGSPFGAGGTTTSVAFGDADGDGDLDIAAAKSGVNNVTLLLNNGTGSYTAAPGSPFAAGTAPVVASFGDVDSDGDLDLAIANATSNDVTLLLNSGAGLYSPAAGSPFAVGTNPQFISLGDVDGMNGLDIVTANFGSNNVSVLLNNGSGLYTPVAGSPFATGGTTPRSTSLGDVDGDGDLDLAVANSGNAALLLNDGNGSFTPASGSPFLAGTGLRSVNFGDVDGDGDLDLAVANQGSNNVSILLNARPPRINPIGPPLPLPIGNRWDYQREVGPQRNSHTQTFGAFPVRVTFDQPVTSATAAFPNVLPPSPMATTPGAIRIHGSMTGHRSTLSALGTWNYIAATRTAEYIPPAANPFRAGETVMVTVTNAQASTPGGQVFSTSPTVYAFTVAPSGGNGRFVDSRRWDDAGVAQCVALADFDLDGKIDMMQGSSNGLNLRLQNNPLGNPTSFANPATNIFGASVPQCISADFDSDGRPDIAFIDVGAGSVVLRRNNPLGSFATPLATFTPGGVLDRIVAADFDGDGDMDIAAASNTGLFIYLNDGNGATFSLAVNLAVSTRGVVALDADNDGDMDLATCNGTLVRIWLNRGANTGLNSLFNATLPLTYFTMNSTDIATGDFNNDGYTDLAVGTLANNNFYTLTNQANGTGTFNFAVTYNTGSPGVTPLVGDFDGDGVLDIVAWKPGDAPDTRVLFYKGAGGAAFNLPISMELLEATSQVAITSQPAVGDIDGDGDLDLAIPLLDGRRTAILFNHQPELKVQATSPLANASSVALPVAITTIFNQNVTTNTASLPPTGPLRVFGNMTGGRSRAGGGTWSSPAPPINQATFSANTLSPFTSIRYYPGEKVEFIASTHTYIAAPPGVTNTVPMTTGTVRQFWTKAGTGPATFFQHFQSPIPTPSNTSIILTADFNRDGRMDFVTSESNTTLRVYFGNANGTFTAAGTVTTPGTAPADRRMALGDMDNDGDVDIIHSNALGAAQITIHQNNGAGIFPVATTINVPTDFVNPRGLAIGDVNGDGALDIGVSYNSNNIGIHLNIGDGNMQPAQVYVQGVNPREETAFADMDNDGDLDWVITNGIANSVSIRLNNGAGNFDIQAAGSPYVTTVTNPTNIQLMDINNDSRIDAVVGGPNANVNIFLNTGMPTIFPAAATLAIPTTSNRPLLGDFNGDAQQDITVLQRTPGNFVVGLGNNSGTFPALSAPNQVGTVNLSQAIADVDNDGDLDILIAADNTVQVWLNATQPRFVCNSMVDCGPPTYTPMITPQRNVHTAITSSLFTWQFTEPMTTATASFPTAAPPAGTEGPIRVFGNMRASRSVNGGGSGPWTYTALSPNTTATLMPLRAMLPGEEMMVSVTNARAASGIAVRPYVYSFRARAGMGPGQFHEVQRPFVGAGALPTLTCVGDFDQDNDVDIAVFNSGANGRIYINNAGVFTPGANLAVTGANPSAVIGGDFDNDGDVDMIVSYAGSTFVELWTNAGGVFTLASSPTVGCLGNGLAALDADADGDLDLAVSICGGNVQFMTNNGLGTFTSGLLLGTGGNPRTIQAGDFDNDGDMDIAVENSLASNITVYVNSGLGTFSAGPTLAGGRFCIVDANNDRNNDIVAIGALGVITAYLNNGNALFTAAISPALGDPANAIIPADVDGDGDMDIAVSLNAGQVGIGINNGMGSFAAGLPGSVAAAPQHLAAGDFDGDGDMDLVVPNQGNNDISILFNATQPRLVCTSSTDCGPPTYTRAISPQRSTNTAPNQAAMTWQFTEQITAATYSAIGAAQGPLRIFGMMTGQRNTASGGAWSYAMAATTASFNLSRRFLNGEEVMVTMTSAQASLARVNVRPFVYSYRVRAGIGPAIFGNQEFSPYASGTNPQDVALGDINGDGRVDMLTATASGIVRRLNDGTGNFTANNITIPTIASPAAIALGDADNDGDLDIAVAGGASVSVLLNNGMGVFTTMSGFPLAVGGNMVDIAWGDMNADGDLDLVLADRAASQIRLVNNNIDAAAFTLGAATGISGTPANLAVADLDNDGDLDVAAANNGGTSGLAIALNDGNGNLSLMPGTPIVTPSAPEGVAVGDLDNDGDNDIALVTTTPDNALIYRNTMGAFTLASTHAVGASPSDVGLGDVDGDGDLDLVSINNGANTATLWKNDGSGFFSQTASGSPYGLGMQPFGVAFADLDGDGDLDFASANSASNTTSVMMNQGDAGLAFSLTNAGFTNLFNNNNPVIVSRTQTPFTIGSFLGKTNLSNTSATLQYSIQAAGGGNAQFSITGSSQGTINNASSISTIATFVWRNAPVRGGVTTAVITVSPTFAGLLNATQITVTVIAESAFPRALAFSQSSSTGTQGVNFGAFNQGQLLSASGRPMNLAFGAWNGWNELAATDATLRLRAFNTQGQEGNFTLNGTPNLLSGIANAATGIFNNLRIVWLNAPETAVSTQVTLRLVSEGPAILSATNVTLTLLREPLEPQVISFSPSTGATGTIVTVRGTGLMGLTGAAVAGVPVQSFTVNSANQVSLVVAAGTSGTIVLTNSFGFGESIGTFNFVEFPTLLGIQPPSACAGQTLTITGTNIADVQQVFVGSVPAASFRVNERGQVEAVVPQNADNGIVTLQNRAGTAVLNIMLIQTPIITGISPSIVGTGGTLTVTGRNLQFTQAAQLFPNTLQILSQSATTMTLRVSTQAQVITAPLRLESGNGCLVLSTQAIAIAAPPTLTAVNTSSPEVGQTLVLTGTNFVPGMTITLGDVTAATVEVVSPTEVRVSFSTNALVVASTGAVLQATTPFGTATLQNTLVRLLPATVIPANIDFTPDTGTIGSTIVITGRGFVDVTAVSFGGTPAQSFRVESPSRIVAIVGAGGSGTVRVRSTTGTGESMRTFTYLTPQQLDSLAAVNFYRATNGATWTTSANWLVPQQPLNRWFGLTIAQSGANAGRIIAVNLPGNNVSVPAQNVGSSGGGGSASSAVSVTNAIIALSQMTALQTVNLSNNTLQGTLGSVVAGLRSVRSLNLANTGLSGRIPVELGTLDSLEVLKLDSNRFDGTLGDVFCTVFGQSVRNYALREIRVASNMLTGEIPPCIVQFTRLQILRLEDNQFINRIPEGINRLANLREFVVARNRLSGELPRSLDSTTFAVFAGKQTSETNALTQLELFDVSNNQLSGTIPNGIAQSRGMKILLLHNNQFSGSLPQTIPALTALEIFNAAQNQLSGELWENVGAMRSLREFSVRNNRISGIIPSSFVQIPSLQRLELDNNSFAGNAPTELARMASLRVLGLSQNRLRTVPSLNALRQTLDSTRLERNMLTFESIETSVQLRNFTYSPQDSVGEASSRFVLVGSPITFNFSVGGAFNRYQWFRNGVAATDAQESPEFTLTRAALAGNSGVYECRITNSLARDLTLYARPLTVRVDTAEPTNEAVLANQVAAPRLVFPYPAGRNMPYELPLTWRRALGAAVYEAQFSLLSDFSVLASNATISSTTLSVSGLRPGTRYYWRVRGIGAEGQRSAWSSDFFTTGTNDRPMQMTSIDFGRVSLADSVEGEALVVNFSNVSQTLQDIGLEDRNLSFAILDNVQQVIIPAGKYLTVRVRFAPRSTGVKLATTLLRYNESLRPERIDSVVNILQGTGVALKLTDVDFGIVRAGGTTLKSALLINTSPRPVTVQQARARDNDRIFSVEGYLGNRSFTIQALDTLLLLVRCSPPNAGRKFNGVLVLGDNDSVRAEIRADARAFKEGDVVMRFGVRPKEKQESIAPGGLVDVELFGKIDMGKTSDLIRAFDNLLQYQARFNMDPNVLILDTTERRAQQRRYIGVVNRVFVNIPPATFDISTLRNISETKRDFVLTSLKGRSVSGSTATTTLEVEQAEWSASAPNLFVESPINSTFTARPCEAGGVRLTTTAQPNSVAIARPNPVKDVAEIQYALREDGNIAFVMVDMSGKQVSVLAEGYAEAGEYSMMLDVKAVPSGTYFLVLQTQSGVVRRRVEVVK